MGGGEEQLVPARLVLLSVPCLPLGFVCPQCFAEDKLPEPKRRRNQNKLLQSNYSEGLIYRENLI